MKKRPPGNRFPDGLDRNPEVGRPSPARRDQAGRVLSFPPSQRKNMGMYFQ